MDKRKIIEDIQKEIIDSLGTHIGTDYVNILKLVSEGLFTKSSSFINELIQNAEDSGLGLNYLGVFEIKLNRSRIMVTHNGRPFSEDEVRALCGIRSTKKPERGTCGCFGVGFKSVSKASDRIEVYSNGFSFEFNRYHNDWGDSNENPWNVLLIPREILSEPIDYDKTTFIIQIREDIDYLSLIQDVKEELKTEKFLFLTWLKKIKLHDEISGESFTIEIEGENEKGIKTLKRNGIQQQFKVFRRTLRDIPSWVKNDRVTKEYRNNVTQREIAIAFAIDEEDNLIIPEAGSRHSGIYSFLPLEDTKSSGIKFYINADFLVQLGRNTILYEAKWNQWLLKENARLFQDAVNTFKEHDKWKYQFLPFFEFNKAEGTEFYNKLLKPKFIELLEKFFERDSCIPTIDGDWTKYSQAVRLDLTFDAYNDLIKMGIIDNHGIADLIENHRGQKLVAPEVKERESKPIRKINAFDLLTNPEFLEKKCQSGGVAHLFYILYLWLAKHT